MIASITGLISSLEDKTIVVDTVSGIGYELFITPASIQGKNIGDQVHLHTYLQVRDDAHVLFGFAHNDEKLFFTILLSVPGVGPKTAFSIVCHISFEDAVQAVRSHKVEVFSNISGIGKKTALKIMLELSQKFKEDFVFEQVQNPDDQTVLDALIQLGYRKQEAVELLRKIPAKLSIEDKIQAALKATHS